MFQAPNGSPPSTRQKLRILVHNVSHSDLLVSLQCTEREWQANSNEKPPPGAERALIARPQYARFQPCSEMLLKQMQVLTEANEPVEVVYHSMATTKGTAQVPIGFSMGDHPVEGQRWADYHLRPSVNKRVLDQDPRVQLKCVYFPMMAVLLPHWLRRSHGAKKVLYLLSGEGNSRNPAHGTYDNSTQGTAELIQAFVLKLYPDVEVSVIHSTEGIFRYRDNVHFVNNYLTPCIMEHRRLLVQANPDDWNRRFHVTVSLSDGAPARLSAVMNSMAQFHADYLHLWQPKSFFHFGTLSHEDVEHHSFEMVGAQPALPLDSPELDDDVKTVVKEMMAHKKHFEMVRDGRVSGAELEVFWLRKTKKPVLCVLMIQKPDSPPVFIKGMNIEVSMPTGTLCSERNAIGNALAADPTLCRKDFRLIAVLSMTLTPPAPAPTFRYPSGPSSPKLLTSPKLGSQTFNFKTPPENDDVNPLRRLSEIHIDEVESSSTDLNPLGPCGSCMEWLKKIAEVNPDFRVITFSDSSCTNVFVKNVFA